MNEPSAPRAIFDDDHHAFRTSFSAFVAQKVTPHYLTWEAEGIVPRSFFTDAGAHGFTGLSIPISHGGGGCTDFRFNQIIGEELAYAGIGGAGLGLTLHNDITTPYYVQYATESQATSWLPRIASGELITAIAMTEPGTGSDLAGISTTATRDGDGYLLSGSKTFITNGINADLIIVAARTESPHRDAGALSLLVVERGMAGFERGRNLQKIGMHSQDTAELFFDQVRVPIDNVLGTAGRGFEYLTSNLAQERLSIAITAVAAARAALAWTLDHVLERTAFGTPIGAFQNTKFVLAEIKSEVDIGQAFVDQCVLALNNSTLSGAHAAQAKYWCTELQKRAVDRCLQLFGGYGYMTEYPIARAYCDARVTSIYGGTTEIMKTIIAKSLGL